MQFSAEEITKKYEEDKQKINVLNSVTYFWLRDRVVPEGVHKIKVLEARDDLSKSGDEMITVLVVQVLVNADGKEKSYIIERANKSTGDKYGVMWISAKSAYFFKKNIMALGLEKEFAAGCINASDVVGKEGRALITQTKVYKKDGSGDFFLSNEIKRLLQKDEDAELLWASYLEAKEKSKAQEVGQEKKDAAQSHAESKSGAINDEIPF